MDYAKVIASLKKRFPSGTVVNQNRHYIPNQVYTDRLEMATGSEWSYELRELEINPGAGYIKAIVRIYIADYFRDGYGVDTLTDSSKIPTITDQVINQAFVNALDSWQMGWADLAPHRKWGENPALAHLKDDNVPPAEGVPTQSKAVVNKVCAICSKQLGPNEVALLKAIPGFNLSKLAYCFEHIPGHFKKKLPPEILQGYIDNSSIN
ncbi:hypothetical protein [Paenibacillus sp. A3M_27_13]|uniref:hypothetical protein n=1 Tax=Paenibacillus sp. A3M_27_13 TaxID=2962029 RepID=UPI0020B73B43|nr:hypothetical protein [Paenibacillus sp. A3M_27_13]MCP3746769.1 hypothetical protein [Paenibacillus sp. A3M_27_13]